MIRKNDTISAKSLQHNGWLIIQASTAKQTYPVVGASVTVTQNFSDGPVQLFQELTDISGMTPPMSLQGIPHNQTLSPLPDYQGIADRYSYDVVITHPQYVTMIYYQIPVYEGITSVQNVDMVPKSISLTPDTPIKINERQTVI